MAVAIWHPDRGQKDRSRDIRHCYSPRHWACQRLAIDSQFRISAAEGCHWSRLEGFREERLYSQEPSQMRVAADRGAYARSVRRNVGKQRVENAARCVLDPAKGSSR